jgi:hypothetical protein
MMLKDASLVPTNTFGNRSLVLRIFSRLEYEFPGGLSSMQGIFWILIIMLYKYDLSFAFVLWTADLKTIVQTSKTQDGVDSG